MTRTIISFIILLASAALYGQNYSAQIVTIPAPSLEGNILGDTSAQCIEVYLPKSYTENERTYPVIYFLNGYGSEVGGGWFTSSLDQYFNENPAHEVIFIVAQGRNKLGGSFYVNSPVTGNWEDYIVTDLVEFVDSNYRTIAHAASRSITGHSMGGFGCLYIATRHPDVFNSVYSHSPGLFDRAGLEESQMFDSKEIVESHFQFFSSLEKTAPDKAHEKMLEKARTNDDWVLTFTMAYGVAFCPNRNKNAPYMNYPKNSDFVTDTIAWKQWHDGFGFIANHIKKYKENLNSLSFIGIDCGYHDNFPWIYKGTKYLSEVFNEHQINHSLILHQGDHGNMLLRQIEESMFPLITKKLVY
jgi:S-formylglutathione hydrolase